MFLNGSTASIFIPAGSAGWRERLQTNIPMLAVTRSPNTKVSQAGTSDLRRDGGVTLASTCVAGAAVTVDDVIPAALDDNAWANSPGVAKRSAGMGARAVSTTR